MGFERHHAQPFSGGPEYAYPRPRRLDRTMSIRPPLASRLIYGVGGAGVAAFALIGTVYAITAQNAQPFVAGFFGIVLAGIFSFIGMTGARSNWLNADERTVSYDATFASPKVVARDRLASIVRVSGLKGVTALEFRSRDGAVLLEAGASFSRPDVERLADYLRVPLGWDL